MSGLSASGSRTPSGFVGALRSWLRAWSGETAQSPDDLQSEADGPHGHCYGSVRVLVVDDDPVNLSVMAALMASKGLVPLLAADGAEAVALACEIHFDLILMDLQMPILDGLGATAAIRRFEDTCSRPAVPVIAHSSALPGAGILDACGISGRLTKPCDDQDLEDCLLLWCPTYRSPPAARRGHHDIARRSTPTPAVDGR
jgi:CheY-like chemotaxis protein